MPPTGHRLFDSCMECRHRGLRLFCSLSDASLQRLDEIGMHVALPGRAVVFSESQASKTVFIVCEGQLKLSASSSGGRTMILRLAGPGDLLGLSRSEERRVGKEC